MNLSAKHLSLLVLVVQETSLILMIRSSRMQEGDAYLVSTAVFVAECFKLVLNLCLASFVVRGKKEDVNPLSKIKAGSWSDMATKDGLKMAVPAFLYVVQNNLYFFALGNLSVPVFQVTAQLKLLTTAVCSRVLLHTEVSSKQYLALLLLAVGVAVVHLSSMEHPGDAETDQKQNHFIGFVAVIASCFTSGFAGVYFELVLKSTRHVSLYMRNSQLALWSIPLAMLPIYFNDLDKIQTDGFFHGYDWFVFAVILNQALVGLIVSFCMKYADTILKSFAVSLSIVVATVFTVLVWNAHVDGWFLVGAAMVLCSVRLYVCSPFDCEQLFSSTQNRRKPVIAIRKYITLIVLMLVVWVLADKYITSTDYILRGKL